MAFRSLLLTAAALFGCAPPTLEVSLVDPTIAPAAGGEAGWEYARTAEVDLDGDGEDERIVLTANVSLMNGRPLWEDGHTWQLYVEERGGDRTDLYAGFIPFGHLEVLFSAAEPGSTPRLILIERAQMDLGVYRVTYVGPGTAEVERLAAEPLDPTVDFGGTQDGISRGPAD